MRHDRSRRALASFAMILALGAPAWAVAVDATERLFAPGALVEVPNGAVLVFERRRSLPEGASIDPIETGSVRVALGPNGERVDVSFDEVGREIVLPPSPASAAHPVLLLFLETTHTSVAALTGGSPYYIKNRFIESFQSAAELSSVQIDGDDAERLVYRPFEDDPNAGRMGPLAALELAFVLSDTVPGGLVSAAASAGDYAESMTFERLEEN